MHGIEILDLECVLDHVTGVQIEKQKCPNKSATLDLSEERSYEFALYRVSQKKVPSIEIRPFVLNVRCDTFGNLTE